MSAMSISGRCSRQRCQCQRSRGCPCHVINVFGLGVNGGIVNSGGVGDRYGRCDGCCSWAEVVKVSAPAYLSSVVYFEMFLV